MARPLRFEFPGPVDPGVCSGERGKPIVADDEDRIALLAPQWAQPSAVARSPRYREGALYRAFSERGYTMIAIAADLGRAASGRKRRPAMWPFTDTRSEHPTGRDPADVERLLEGAKAGEDSAPLTGSGVVNFMVLQVRDYEVARIQSGMAKAIEIILNAHGAVLSVSGSLVLGCFGFPFEALTDAGGSRRHIQRTGSSLVFGPYRHNAVSMIRLLRIDVPGADLGLTAVRATLLAP